MKLNKKHTVYFAIGALGIGFLAFDRVITPGQEAEAASIVPDAGATVPATAPATAPHPVVSAVAPGATADKVDEQVADHLETVAAEHHFNLATTREAFTVAAGWGTTRTSGVVDNSSLAFASRHRLLSVVVSGHSAGAMIDGRLLRVGDDLDGMKLTAVSKQGAMFSSGGRQVELTFKSAEPQQP
jgi:hypothetical protein